MTCRSSTLDPSIPSYPFTEEMEMGVAEAVEIRYLHPRSAQSIRFATNSQAILNQYMTDVPELAQNYDPFTQEETAGALDKRIDLRIKTRGRRKYLTIIENLPKEFNLRAIAQRLKREFSCICSVRHHVTTGKKLIVMTGDQREKLRELLLQERMAEDEEIVVHGF